MEVENKTPDVSALETTVVNTKINEVQSKISNSSGLVSTTVLNAKTGEVENKIPDISGLVQKTYYSTKVKEKEFVDQTNLVKKIRFKLKTCNIINRSRVKSRAR